MTTTIIDRIKNISSNIQFNAIPKVVKIELTTHCNHQCSYCYNSTLLNKEHIADNIFYFIIKALKKYNIQEIGLFHIGESTLHPKFLNFFQFTKKELPNTKIFLTTNGTNFQLLKQLIYENIDSIKFSLNGYNRKNHLLLTKIDDFNLIISNIKKLVQYRNKIHSKTELSGSAILNSNISKQIQFENKMIKILDNFYKTELFTQGNNITNIQEFHDKSCISTHNFPCYTLFNMCQILLNGDITICKWDKNKQFIIGNIFKNTLYESWNSKNANKIRNNHLNNKIEMCINCMKYHGSI